MSGMDIPRYLLQSSSRTPVQAFKPTEGRLREQERSSWLFLSSADPAKTPLL